MNADQLTYLANWLALFANGAGLLGSIFIAAPFFRQERIKAISTALRDARTASESTGAVFKKAAKVMEKRFAAWDPIDYRIAVAGITLIGISYLLNSVYPLIYIFKAS